MKYFWLIICLSLLSIFHPAVAAIEVKDDGGGSGQASVLTQSGQYYVRIAKANEQGLSVNYFKDFSAQGKNIVLLNSFLMNPKIGQSPAQTIVLVVDQNQIADIQSIQVEGHAADIVLAAPDGIRCNGCSIKNTERVTLATGAVQIENGELKVIDITGGSVDITGAGLQATDLSLLDIAAGHVLVDAPLRTNMKGSLSTRNNQEVKEIDAGGDLEVSNGDVQIIVGKNHFRYLDRQSDAYYQQFSGKAYDYASHALEITDKGKVSVGNLHLESTYDLGSILVKGLIRTQGNWTYVGRYNEQSIVPLESVTIKSNGNVYLSEQIIAANKVDIESTRAINIAALSAGDNYLLDSIQGAEVKVVSVGPIKNQGAISAESVYFSGQNIINEGDIEATRDLYLNGQTGVKNQYGGIILGENIELVSEQDVINGEYYPFKPAEICAMRSVVNNSPSVEVGGKLAVPPFKGCGKVAANSLSAYILGQNIKVVAQNFSNANPYEVSRNTYTDPELNLDLTQSEQVVVSAESIMDIRVNERFWNMSAVVESWTGNVILQAPIIDNERYHIWADTYEKVVGDPNGTHTNQSIQYLKVLSPPARLNVGQDLILNSDMLNNEHSSVEVKRDVSGSVNKIWMEGLKLRDIFKQTTVTQHSKRYCSKRVFGHCIKHKRKHWTTSSVALTKNEETAQYPFIFYVDGHIHQGFGSEYSMLQNITFGPEASAYEPQPTPEPVKPGKPGKYIPISVSDMTIFVLNPSYKEGDS
ncbi:two-partner secretion domain-containing protein [Vibrio mangrovi]|uniref:Filamentous hemagglutinin N-terminal domain-containing protein n=1 Tax=Vibrio mangrovi TaxID=474394 RepID=A0ABU4I9Y2_9VIBR|nr:filamentous hemagglutinin N-terminal domain-containing protein [Vibrio mangrovi]MDW6004664.1 filamentous hemagglutinin N-terminal domain-containing protein [Vibrio mangrovi]